MRCDGNEGGTFQSSSLLPLSPETKTRLIARARISVFIMLLASIEHGGETRAVISGVIRKDTLGLFAPRSDRTFISGGLAPDEAGDDVETTDGEQEECRDECKVIDEMGQNGGSDAKRVCVNLGIAKWERRYSQALDHT
jgi:hypothetical protein